MNIYTTKDIIEDSENLGDKLCEQSDDPYGTVEWEESWNTKFIKVEDLLMLIKRLELEQQDITCMVQGTEYKEKSRIARDNQILALNKVLCEVKNGCNI